MFLSLSFTAARCFIAALLPAGARPGIAVSSGSGDDIGWDRGDGACRRAASGALEVVPAEVAGVAAGGFAEAVEATLPTLPCL
jgi:hypothetical protein